MHARVVLLWVVGLLTIVPYGTYHLLFHARPDEYALLVTLVLFWIFGFWGVVGPLLAAANVRRVMRAIEAAQSRGRLVEALRSADTREAAIDLIASENRIPRFLARRVYRLLASRLSAAGESLRGEGPDGLDESGAITPDVHSAYGSKSIDAR